MRVLSRKRQLKHMALKTVSASLTRIDQQHRRAFGVDVEVKMKQSCCRSRRPFPLRHREKQFIDESRLASARDNKQIIHLFNASNSLMIPKTPGCGRKSCETLVRSS